KTQTQQSIADAQAKADAQRVAQQVKTTAKPSRAATIGSIDFRGSEGASQVDIAVGRDAVVTIGEVTPTHGQLIVDHAELAPKLERTLDVSKFGSPVKAVSSFRDRKDPDRVRLVAELVEPATPTVDRDAGAVHWHFDVAKHAMHTTVISPV